MPCFAVLLKLFAGKVAGGSGRIMGSRIGGMAGPKPAKGLTGGCGRGLGGGLGAGQGGGKGGGKGGGQGRCGCGQNGGGNGSSERLVKIVELVAKRLAERHAGQAPQTEKQPALDSAPAKQPALATSMTPETLVAGQDAPVLEPAAIEIRAVAMTAYVCQSCARRISCAADEPITDARCPQCGGPMAPQA